MFSSHVHFANVLDHDQVNFMREKTFRNLAENLIFFTCLASLATVLLLFFLLKFRYSEKVTQFEKYPNSV